MTKEEFKRFLLDKSVLIGFFIGMCFSVLLSMVAALTILPGLISDWLPVVKLRIVGQAEESPKRLVSFYLEGHKLRTGVPEYYNFFVVNQLNQEIPVSVFKGNDDCSHENQPLLINHKPTDNWIIHYCFSLDGVLEPGQSYRVVGEAGHTAWPWISIVRTQLPVFVPVKVENLVPWGGLGHGP